MLLNSRRAPPTEITNRANLLPALLPEVSATLVVLWCIVAPWFGWRYDSGVLYALMFAEVGSLMLNASLVDVATRLQRPPSIGWGLFIVLGLMVLNPISFSTIASSWSLGWMMFLPQGWSMVERFRRIWILPRVSKLDKIRTRALTFDRLYLGVHIAMLSLVSGFLYWAVNDYRGNPVDGVIFDIVLPWVLLVFFAANAWNTLRVYQDKFAKKPKSMMPWFDKGDATYLDPLI
jgi:hypothetical protein